MSEDAPDTTTMSGAEFQRYAGTDPEKWAEAFRQAFFANSETWLGMMAEDATAMFHGKLPHGTSDDRADADRLAFIARWFRDYAEVRVAEEVGRVTARLVPRHDD